MPTPNIYIYYIYIYCIYTVKKYCDFNGKKTKKCNSKNLLNG